MSIVYHRNSPISHFNQQNQSNSKGTPAHPVNPENNDLLF